MTPSGQPLAAKRLRGMLGKALRTIQAQPRLDPVQRAGLRSVVQTITWALHDLEEGAPAMDPVDTAMLGPRPAGGVRRDYEKAMGPKVWRQSGFVVGAE